MNPKIVSSDDVTPQSRKSPAAVLIESVGDEYMTMKKMSERYGVHIETMRRVSKAVDRNGQKVLKAPSSAVQQGGLVIYLFTEEDVAEVDAYMLDRGYTVKK